MRWSSTTETRRCYKLRKYLCMFVGFRLRLGQRCLYTKERHILNDKTYGFLRAARVIRNIYREKRLETRLLAWVIYRGPLRQDTRNTFTGMGNLSGSLETGHWDLPYSYQRSHSQISEYCLLSERRNHPKRPTTNFGPL